MTSRLASDIIIIPVLPKLPCEKLPGLISFKNFQNQTTGCGDVAYFLVGYFISSHPVVMYFVLNQNKKLLMSRLFVQKVS